MKLKNALIMGLCGLLAVAMVACTNVAGDADSVDTSSTEEVSDVVSDTVSEEASDVEVDSADENSEEEAQDEEEEVAPETDGVAVTIPTNLLSADEDGTLTEQQEADGFQAVVKNGDGSITYLIQEDRYDAYVESLKADTISMLDDLATGEYSSIQGADYDRELSQVLIYVDETGYAESDDSYVVEGVGTSITLYHLFAGESYDDIEVVIQLQTTETNEVLETYVFPHIG